MRKRLALVAVLSMVAAFAATSSATVVFPRTLKRQADPVIFEVRGFADVLGAPIECYRAYALRGDRMEPIPYQFDERDAKGELVFPNGPKAGQDNDKGKLDANDLLVFMVSDAGAKAPSEFWPKGLDAAAEVELTDPIDNGKAWVYVFRFPSTASAPPRSPVDYASYNHQTKMVHTKYFIMGFSPEAPIGIGYLGFTKEGGGDGANYADRLKIRFEADTLFGIHISKNEEAFTSETIAWIDGPVRVVRRTRNRMILFWKIPTPSAVLDNIYYANAFEFPTRVDLPFDVDSMLSNPKFYVSTDAAPTSFMGTFYNERNPRGVRVDGKMSPEEKAMDHGPYKWMAMAGSQGEMDGAFINRLVYDAGKTEVVPTLFYLDDLTRPSPPEKYPGSFGEAGYVLSNLESVEAGTLELVSIMYQTRDFQPGDEVEFMNILDRPIKARVSFAGVH